MGGDTNTLNAQRLPEVSSPGNSHRKRWAFRLAAVALGLLPLLAIEGVCILFGWGRPSLHDDPFIGFTDIKPLFVRSDDGMRREIPKSRQAFFCADSFAAKKAPGEFRIFCLGGSTVQGSPFHIQTAFSTWLELSLKAAQPERTWRVINCGGVSYASYRLVPILEEVLDYDPDLIILMTGHNEFLEARTFEHIAGRGELVNASLKAASRLRTFTLLREGYLRMQGFSSDDPPQGRPILPTEVETLLDYRGGLEQYHHDDAWHNAIVQQFEYNLRRMMRTAQERHVPIWLINPPYNLRDCPPFKSQHDSKLSADQLARWETLIESAHRHLRRHQYDPYQALSEFQQACQLDPLHAGGFYSLAECLDTLGKHADAKQAYERAKELDVCPLRILNSMNQAVLDVANDSSVPLLDARELFESVSKDGIPGGDWFVDHVHPKFEGHQLLADRLADMMVAHDLVRPRAQWKSAKDDAYTAHFDSLSPLYFEKGMQRLEAQNDWAHGRARRLKPSGTSASN